MMEFEFDMALSAACLLLIAAAMDARSVSILAWSGTVSMGPLRELLVIMSV